MIHLDTHVVVWLAAGDLGRLPPALLERIEADDVAISPTVRLELSYLKEIGRLSQPADRIVGEMQRSIRLTLDTTAFDDVVREAESMTWTRDPFDRIIVAQALAARCRLATADRAIRDAVPDLVVWDGSD